MRKITVSAEGFRASADFAVHVPLFVLAGEVRFRKLHTCTSSTVPRYDNCANILRDSSLHGKDLSKADVSVNIFAWLLAQQTRKPVCFSCAIGDTEVGGIPHAQIVEAVRSYIQRISGFKKFAEWGLLA